MFKRGNKIMKSTEKSILDAISELNVKVDSISAKIGGGSADRLDNETVVIISAIAYRLFGKQSAIHSIKLLK